MSAHPHAAQPLVNCQKAAFYLVVGACLIGLILTSGTWVNSSRAAVQQSREERVIVKRVDFSPPVKITLAKTRRGPIGFSEKYLDDEDWFKGLTVVVTNGSDKGVIYVGVEMTFLRPENQEEAPAVWHLEYGDNPFRYKTAASVPPISVKPISPDDAAEISLNDANFDDIKAFLKDVKYSGSKAIELRITTIGFSDRTAWYVGNTFERDPASPRGWRRTNLTLEPKVKRPNGSPQIGSANFFRMQFDKSKDLTGWRYVKTKTATATSQAQCGTSFPSIVHLPAPA